jgi:hypothetical protein
MILRCKKCDTFLGIHEPLGNWATDRFATCATCLEKQFGKETTDYLSDSSTEHPILPFEEKSPAAS